VTAPAGPGRQTLGVPQKTLLDVQARLEGLRGYIDEYPFPRHQAEGDVRIAWDQEELSLHGMGVLITQTIEAISFVLLLADYKLGDIVAKSVQQF
jgi:nuclear pore complex protein Nup155